MKKSTNTKRVDAMKELARALDKCLGADLDISIEATNNEDEIPVDVVETLVVTIRANYETSTDSRLSEYDVLFNALDAFANARKIEIAHGAFTIARQYAHVSSRGEQ